MSIEWTVEELIEHLQAIAVEHPKARVYMRVDSYLSAINAAEWEEDSHFPDGTVTLAERWVGGIEP